VSVTSPAGLRTTNEIQIIRERDLAAAVAIAFSAFRDLHPGESLLDSVIRLESSSD
jgi:hypothetical protein